VSEKNGVVLEGKRENTVGDGSGHEPFRWPGVVVPVCQKHKKGNCQNGKEKKAQREGKAPY